MKLTGFKSGGTHIVRKCAVGGEAPPDIGYLTALKVLDLSECGFEGGIPSGKFGWTYETALLEEIYINGNNFTGDITDEFG